MKTFLWKSKLFLMDMLHPIPDVETEANKFFTLKLEFLSMRDITEIIRIILLEVRKSRGFGLFIEPKHLEKEEIIFLTAINKLGNIKNIREHIPWNITKRFFDEIIEEHFAEEMKYYFDRAKENNESVKNKYQCHLFLGVRLSLLHELYSKNNKSFN